MVQHHFYALVSLPIHPSDTTIPFSVALGAHVTVISTSESKRNDAMTSGASAFVISKDPEQLKAVTRTFGFILDTVSAQHDVQAMSDLLEL